MLASYGHVRDLPPKDGSVRPDEDFAMSWEVDAKAEKRLNDIATRGQGRRPALSSPPTPIARARRSPGMSRRCCAERKALKGVDVKRVVFNEVTKQAVLDAFRHPRELDRELVDAYLARRALDYLVGFTLSPVLWRKLPGSRSAGRVQSVALRLVCEREDRDRGVQARSEYWTVEAEFANAAGERFTRAPDPSRRQEARQIRPGRREPAARAAADKILAAAELRRRRRSRRSRSRRNPPPPFTTSTLQQEASRKLGLGASRTMRIAQRLYEGVDIGGDTVGLITYMRTDGVTLSSEAIAAARRLIEQDYGAAYVPDEPRIYRTQAKNAQEAHEAIRPDRHVPPARRRSARQLDAEQRRSTS